jgi:hypothetical protein
LAQSKTTKQPQARHFESPPSKTFSFYPILIGGVRNLYLKPGISETRSSFGSIQNNKTTASPSFRIPTFENFFILSNSYWWGEKSLSGARHFRNTFILWLNPKQQNNRKPVISNPHLRKHIHLF